MEGDWPCVKKDGTIILWGGAKLRRARMRFRGLPVAENTDFDPGQPACGNMHPLNLPGRHGELADPTNRENIRGERCECEGKSCCETTRPGDRRHLLLDHGPGESAQ